MNNLLKPLVGLGLFLFSLHSFALTAKCHHENHAEWDYIIVGDGTAGAVLAEKLSNNRQNRVLVVEWGINRTKDPLVLSPDVFNPNAYKLTQDPTYSITNVVPILFNGFAPQFFTYSDGRMWGGSSAHNGMFAVRGTPALYNSWAASSGQAKWNYNNLLPLMKKMEHYHPDGTVANPNQRGLAGPLSITQSPPVNTDAFVAAVSTGTNAPFVTDYNDPSEGNIGVSAHQQFITPGINGHRSFSANAYQKVGKVVTARGIGLDNRKLRIESNALVSHVIIEGKKAIGIEYWRDGKSASVEKAYARKKIILCAGTVQSSAILERSGIGHRARLKALDIDVVVHNPNVGENVLNHYGVGGLISGSTTASPFLAGFINGSPFMPNDDVRRLQLIGINIPAANAVVLNGVLMQSKSKGSTHIISRNPTISPIIDFNMFSDGPVSQVGSDAYLLVSFYKIMQTIAAANGSAVITPPPAAYATDDSLLNYAQTLSNGSLIITYHLVGSARMAQTKANGVVDGNLNVFGVKNLMVADCSIEPFIQDGNTAYSAFIIGLVASNFLK